MSEQTRVSPRDHVFAVVPSPAAARASLNALVQHGFTETVLFEGEEAARELDAKGEHAGALEKVMKMIADHLSEQPNYLSQYQEEARNGNVVLAVRVSDSNEAMRVAELLEAQGARNIRYFGDLAVADLTPRSNPSTRSDESPEREKWSKQ